MQNLKPPSIMRGNSQSTSTLASTQAAGPWQPCGTALASIYGLRLTASFPQVEGRDPKINTENIILLLAAYPESAVRMLVDPVAGLQTKSTFLPGPDVIKSALESWCAPMVRAAADHARQVQRQALPAPVIRSPEATRQEVTARIKAKHGPGWGIGGDEKWPRDACLRAAAQDALPLTLSAEALAKMAAKQEHSA